MDQLVINAASRTEKGKAVARRLRVSGKLPAVLYNSEGKSTMLSVDEVEFNKVWRNITPTTLVSVKVDGTSHDVFIKDTEYNIRTDKVLHVDFYEPAADKIVTVKMPVHFKGTPVGVLKGGFLRKHLPDITIKAVAKNIPVRIEADISKINAGETFSVKDLSLGKDVTVVTPADSALISVSAGK